MRVYQFRHLGIAKQPRDRDRCAEGAQLYRAGDLLSISMQRNDRILMFTPLNQWNKLRNDGFCKKPKISKF
jgi:hypothetical protein